ncbi:MAG: hypothetical protein OXH77_11940 [Anaerolineaceae bacterium]|nr:hypothetical protein [Anaerolineaceae bacterium]
MKSLYRTLEDSERSLLPLLAQIWGVAPADLEPGELVTELNSAMRVAERVEAVWTALDEGQRGALQHLLASGGRMPANMFTRIHGGIRQAGAGHVAEIAHQPASPAEALFYRGLIALAFESADTGPRQVVYVPEDLMDVLPTHLTALDSGAAAASLPTVTALDAVEDPRPADTRIVDDMTTLLAWLQVQGAALQEGELSPPDGAALTPWLLAQEPGRLRFLTGVGLAAGLIAASAGRAQVSRDLARAWLEEGRGVQLRQLARAWRDSQNLRDLWQVPGLAPEEDGLVGYDPTMARGAVLNFIGELTPADDWWSLSDLVAAVKLADPDFQRPGGDYDSWYIRDARGEYVRGFDTWDQVEGALLRWLVQGPLHWLGMTDLADGAARLTAWGRAFLDMGVWPELVEPQDAIEIGLDGALRVPRRFSRLDRFQIARFTSWSRPGDPAVYLLDGAGIAQAERQGINAAQIQAFLHRVSGERPTPPGVARLLQNWLEGPVARVTLERQVLLRAESAEALTEIFETPALRRYLGAQLGPTAVLVRPEQWPALQAALAEAGVQVALRDLGA